MNLSPCPSTIVASTRPGRRTRGSWRCHCRRSGWPSARIGERSYGAAKQHWRELKTTLHMEVLRCKTLDGVLKELYVFALAYNLARVVLGGHDGQVVGDVRRVLVAQVRRHVEESHRLGGEVDPRTGADRGRDQPLEEQVDRGVFWGDGGRTDSGDGEHRRGAVRAIGINKNDRVFHRLVCPGLATGAQVRPIECHPVMDRFDGEVQSCGKALRGGREWLGEIIYGDPCRPGPSPAQAG